jgi:hypothetical protein
MIYRALIELSETRVESGRLSRYSWNKKMIRNLTAKREQIYIMERDLERETEYDLLAVFTLTGSELPDIPMSA